MAADLSLLAALTALHQYEPVTGACLLYSDFIVADNLPCSDKKMNLICGTVTEMCDGYQSVGREITEFYFGYDKCQFFVLCVGPVRLIIVAESSALPDQIGAAARGFLLENAAQIKLLETAELTQRIKLPPPKRAPGGTGTTMDAEGVRTSVMAPEDQPEDPGMWEEYRGKLHQVVSRALGSAQSARLIDRVVREHGYRKQAPLKVDFGSIGRSVVDKVPNRSRRRGLRSVVEEIARPK